MDKKILIELTTLRSHIDKEFYPAQDIFQRVIESDNFNVEVEGYSRARAVALIAQVVAECYIETGDMVSKKCINNALKFKLSYISKCVHQAEAVGLVVCVAQNQRVLHLWPSVWLLQQYQPPKP